MLDDRSIDGQAAFELTQECEKVKNFLKVYQLEHTYEIDGSHNTTARINMISCVVTEHTEAVFYKASSIGKTSTGNHTEDALIHGYHLLNRMRLKLNGACIQ